MTARERATLYDESLRARRRTGEPRGIATTAANFAELELAGGDLALADALIDESFRHAETIGFRPLIALAHVMRAQIALMRGDLQTASAQLQAGIATSANDIETAADQMSVAAALAAAAGQPLPAATLWAAADRARARINLPEPPLIARLHTHWLPSAQAAAPAPGAWTAAWDAGTELSVDDALALTAVVAGDMPWRVKAATGSAAAVEVESRADTPVLTDER